MFHDASRFPFTRVLERHWREILADYRRVRHALVDWPERKLYERGWKVLGIYDFPHGAPIAANVEASRFTASLIEEHVPRHGAVGFSVLEPGTHIVPHEGYQGDFLRCHLALEVPDHGDLGLRVGDEVRRWHVGRGLVFDDRVPHEAWNRSDEERVVLLLDFVPDPGIITTAPRGRR